jgi:hypothetical protein
MQQIAIRFRTFSVIFLQLTLIIFRVVTTGDAKLDKIILGSRPMRVS